LDGWNMERSTVVEGWQAKARAEGEARGRAEGLAKGRAEMLHLLRSLLLEALRAHLRVELPTDLVAAVEAQADPQVLGRWFRETRLTNLEEVRRVLGLS
jgi:predicted transposase YdaD